ncbi:MAG TPA: hypothetical protein PKY53_00240 [Clostridia bacterium]|nr:hypothetical protein [Clostridia bacterium]
MKGKGTAFKRIGLIVLSTVLALSLGACTLLYNLAGLIINSATDTLYNFIASYFDTSEPDNAVYGSRNYLAVGFDNGNMVAFWDDYGDYTYRLDVEKGGNKASYETAEDCSLDLVTYGYSYADDLNLSLYGTSGENESGLLATYSYTGLSSGQYNAYTQNVAGGWDDLDRYIATRYELFEIFNYIILFQPDKSVETKDGQTFYRSEITLFLAYDYLSIYPQGTNIRDAYTTEISSAISAFDDSAGYNYSHYLEDNNKECTIYLRFSYESYPVYTTDTAKNYGRSNFGLDAESPHYYLGPIRERNFAIDHVQKTVSVKTTDQLYFALKRGYRPVCETGSNAEFIYNYMRVILSRINSDITPDDVKVHYIYDYIVDTVLYDYEFTDRVLKNRQNDDSEFFLYKCLYMEGVFGFTNDKKFDNEQCVAICDGIAKAVLCMCVIEGIPTIKVSGASGGVAHAWNKVYLEGSWYLVDATWGNVRKDNGRTEILTHDYLLAADDANHIEDKWISYPRATQSYYR